MLNPVLFSSATDQWRTPTGLFAWIVATLNAPELDVCASADNAQCSAYYTEADNGLRQPWDRPWYCNPPYGRTIGQWTAKAATAPAPGLLLLPARTDTRWFHALWPHCSTIYFLQGRLHFGDAPAGAPFPSLIAELLPGYHSSPDVHIVTLTPAQRGVPCA